MSNAFPPGAESAGAIEIRTSFFPLAFLLFFFPTKVVIDGGPPLTHPWGAKLYPLPPGRHEVRVWCPYLFFRMGETVNVVDVVPGQATGCNWKAPWLAFLPGTWQPLGTRPLAPGELAAAAAGHASAPHGGPQPQPSQQFQAQPQPQPQPGPGNPPPGWHPDPHGQATHRYWDGQRWTEHVAN